MLEKFVSINGCDCYNLPYNTETISIIKESWKVPEKYENVVRLINVEHFKRNGKVSIYMDGENGKALAFVK